MCIKSSMGYSCGHCSAPTLIPCPSSMRDPTFPTCAIAAIRIDYTADMCHPCICAVHECKQDQAYQMHAEMHREDMWHCDEIFSDEERRSKEIAVISRNKRNMWEWEHACRNGMEPRGHRRAQHNEKHQARHEVRKKLEEGVGGYPQQYELREQEPRLQYFQHQPQPAELPPFLSTSWPATDVLIRRHPLDGSYLISMLPTSEAMVKVNEPHEFSSCPVDKHLLDPAIVSFSKALGQSTAESRYIPKVLEPFDMPKAPRFTVIERAVSQILPLVDQASNQLITENQSMPKPLEAFRYSSYASDCIVQTGISKRTTLLVSEDSRQLTVDDRKSSKAFKLSADAQEFIFGGAVSNRTPLVVSSPMPARHMELTPSL